MAVKIDGEQAYFIRTLKGLDLGDGWWGRRHLRTKIFLSFFFKYIVNDTFGLGLSSSICFRYKYYFSGKDVLFSTEL